MSQVPQPSHQVESLLKQFQQLFKLCKFVGLYPYNYRKFERDNQLSKSKHGTWFVVSSVILVTLCYNLLIYSFTEEDRSLKKTQSTLTLVIGIFLTYIGLVMMATDQLTAVRNQRSINELYDRIQAVDERLYKEKIYLNNRPLRVKIRALIALTIGFELVIMLSTYFTLIDHSRLISLLWIFSCVPTFYNSLDKIWFAITLCALKDRFQAINASLEELVLSHEKFNEWLSTNGGMSSARHDATVGVDKRKDSKLENYFHKEMNELGPPPDIIKGDSASSRITPIAHSLNSFGEAVPSAHKRGKRTKAMIDMVYESELNHTEQIEEKLSNLCQMHDELCDIGKTLNELWSYPLLVLMGYGFLIFTAQLYFLYCATQTQPIPSLFRSAKNAVITAIYLAYTSGKCIYLMYLSWKTSLASKHTGVCIHKCCVVTDNDYLYEIINHLSLKLLNHNIDFSACGFFTLDMESLYAVSGGITSYLIILIQFNLAAQQAKEAIRAFANFNETSHMIAAAEGNPAGNFYEATNLSTDMPGA